MAIETNADAEAIARGFTKRIYCEGGMEGGEFLVREDVDLDASFTAWAVDWQEWTVVHGFNVEIEEMAL